MNATMILLAKILARLLLLSWAGAILYFFEHYRP